MFPSSIMFKYISLLILITVFEAENVSSVSITRSMFNSLDQVDLFVTYSWPTTMTNLDTSTQFITESAGSGCPNTNTYVQWGGDITSTGGQKRASVILSQARRDNAIGNVAVVQLNAAYDPGNIGQAKISLILRLRGTTQSIPGSDISLSVFAGTKRGGCCSTPVAVVIIQEGFGRLQMTATNDGLIRPTPRPRNYFGYCYQDPHIVTFDRKYAGCQGMGEFILTKTNRFELQGRFGGLYRTVTLPIGFAIKHGDLPTVQVSVSNDPFSRTTTINGHNYLLVVGGSQRLFSEGTGNSDIQLTGHSTSYYRISFMSTGINIHFRLTPVGSQAKVEGIRLAVPSSFTNGNSFVGLFGSPNGDRRDDIMDSDGNVVTDFVPTQENLYDHCVQNWCIRDERQSLFTYESTSNHATYHNCDREYREVVLGRSLIQTCALGVPCIHESVAQSASDRETLRAVRGTCGINEICLFEGIAMSREENRSVALGAVNGLLQVEAENARNREKESDISFSPSTVVARKNVSIHVVFEIDGNSSNIQRFALYNLDSNLDRIGGDSLGYLTRASPTSNIFTATFFIRTESVGQKLSFRAIPVISGSEVRSSELVKDAIEVISAYRSVPPPVGAPLVETPTPEQVDDVVLSRKTLDGIAVIAQFSWPTQAENLDTATRFLNETAGHLCSPFGKYVRFFGNIRSRGGNEFSFISIGAAEKAKLWKNNSKIEFYAGFQKGQVHPASLKIYLLEERTRKIIEGTTILENIAPGDSNGCADDLVATLVVENKDDFYSFNIDVV